MSVEAVVTYQLIDMSIERVRQRTMQREILKQVSFNSSVVLLGNGASYVNRPDQQQHNNNDNKDDDDRIRWHDVVSVVEEGSGGVGNGGSHG